jgi:A/G-specific adenine glycosylase
MTISAELKAREIPKFRRALLAWYDANRRDLPWRKTRDPYRIWISEIMLQQTRVATVLVRFENFLKRFPTVRRLAAARESSVLAEWSGLGYYRRARNLHAAAKLIVGERDGEFPQSADQWRTLPGIGRYTAAAISSIAFGEAVAVLDGNVERVLQRVLGGSRTDAEFWRWADRLLDENRPGDFNQAMMELGAVVCLPSQPQCGSCPVAKFCRTRGRGSRPGAKPRQHKREVSYSLTCRSGSVLLVQRNGSESLMPGMWELPEADSDVAAEIRLFSVKHAITITDFTVHVVSGSGSHLRGKWVPISRLGRLPLTGLARKVLRRAKVIQ